MKNNKSAKVAGVIIPLCLALFVVFGAGILTVWAAPPSAPLPADIQGVKDRGKLVVAMFNHDRPPFFYENEQGKLSGLDVEIAADIARHLGVALEFNRQARSFDGVVDQVVSGGADVAISKLSITMSRALRVAFTDPYLLFHHALLINRLQLGALMTKNPGKSVMELLSAAPHKIGVRGGTAWVGYAAQSFPKAQVVALESIEELVSSASRGEVLALIYDEYEMKKIMNKSPELNIDLQLLVLPHNFDPIGIAVGVGNQHLLAWLNLYLKYGSTSVLQENDLWREYGAALTPQERAEEQR